MENGDDAARIRGESFQEMEVARRPFTGVEVRAVL
jgi:hypothetical protein